MARQMLWPQAIAVVLCLMFVGAGLARCRPIQKGYRWALRSSVPTNDLTSASCPSYLDCNCKPSFPHSFCLKWLLSPSYAFTPGLYAYIFQYYRVWNRRAYDIRRAGILSGVVIRLITCILLWIFEVFMPR